MSAPCPGTSAPGRGPAAAAVLLLLALVPACALAPARPEAPAGVLLWSGGGPAVCVVLADAPSPAERTAARELAAYLERSAGFAFPVVAESDPGRAGPGIYVGPTGRARAAGLDAAAFGPEQWAIRTAGADVLIAGGRPRGTLYAVYHFLEQTVGVRWWSPFEERVPRHESLRAGPMDRGGQPAFASREIHSLYAPADGGRFAARSRVNGGEIDPAFGSGVAFGEPGSAHTFYRYFPPETDFAAHPEWYSLIGGRRTAERAQLCLTNAELLRETVRRLRAAIEASRAAAAAAGRPAPVDFDISQNDWDGFCECAACAALTRREGSPSGPLIAFLNGVADAIAADYPQVRINTLAYLATADPPRTLRPRASVVPRLCDTDANLLRPATHRDNRAFARRLARWSQITRTLRVWDYAVTYHWRPGLPLPSLRTYAPDYRLFAARGVEGLLTEHEYPILADLRDLKLWVMTKLQEDPRLDEAALVRDFTDGFYGPAGGHVRRYLADLERAADRANASVSWYPLPERYDFLTLDFLRRAQATFDDAERAVAADATLVRRVRHARLPLDRACLVFRLRLLREWTLAGGALRDFPFDHATLVRRVLRTWDEQIDLRIPEGQRAALRALADQELRALSWPEEPPRR